MLTDDELQKSFHLISCLHPDRDVAKCVLLDAYDHIAVIRKLQERRPDSTHPFKLKIPEENLPQLGVYWASEIWEKDQESPHPRKEPKYKPTCDDLLARYVKTLVWKSMDRHSHYAAVGLGCLLYTYQPHEVSSLAEDLFDSDNIRRVKSWMFDKIKKRFQGTNGLTNGDEHVALEIPNNHQRTLIQMSLSKFAPWCSCPAATIQAPSASLLETYFDKKSEKSEWERVHILFDPACGGLARLVHEYNSTYRRGNDMRLDDPDNKLGSPKFSDGFDNPTGDGGDGGPSDPEDRFNPSPLTHHEIASFKHFFERNQRRRKNYHSNQLHVYVDGEETTAFSHDYFVEPFIIPRTASCIEVFGEDEEGELLLAVFPLTYLESGDKILDQKLCVTHERGQTIELTISSVLGQSRESQESLVQLAYSDSPRHNDPGLISREGNDINALDQRQQFEQKWLDYYNFVFGFAFRSLRNRDDAEEVTQTTFLRFVSAMERRRWEVEVVNFKAYLRKIAKPLCYDLWDRRRKEETVSYDDEHDEQTQKDLERKAMESDDSMRKIEDRILYQELFQSLPLNTILYGLTEYELDLLYLSAIDEMSTKEIAEIIGKDVDSVRYHVQKLYAKLRYRGRKYLEITDGKPFFSSQAGHQTLPAKKEMRRSFSNQSIRR